MKDLKMRKSLVHGGINNELYEWPVSHPQAHIISTFSPLTTWHQCLEYPHSGVLRFILNKFSLPFHERDKNFHYNSCLSNKAHRHHFIQLSVSNSIHFKLFLVIYGDHRQSYLLTRSCIIVFLLINILSTLGSTH